MDVTSQYRPEDNQVNGAWAITRLVAPGWIETDGVWVVGSYVPDFTLINSGTVYECPAAFMRLLADTRAGRSDWEANC